MCYAIPAVVIKVDGQEATVDYGGVRKKVNVSLIKGVRDGDYLLVHAGFAIERMAKDEALKSLNAIQDIVGEVELDGK